MVQNEKIDELVRGPITGETNQKKKNQRCGLWITVTTGTAEGAAGTITSPCPLVIFIYLMVNCVCFDAVLYRLFIMGNFNDSINSRKCTRQFITRYIKHYNQFSQVRYNDIDKFNSYYMKPCLILVTKTVQKYKVLHLRKLRWLRRIINFTAISPTEQACGGSGRTAIVLFLSTSAY